MPLNEVSLNAEPSKGEGGQNLANRLAPITEEHTPETQVNPDESENITLDNSKDSLNKFKGEDGNIDYDKLASSYIALEKKFSSREPTTKTAPTSETIKEYAGSILQDPEKSQAFVEEFQEHGKLSDASYKEIGIAPELVDSHLKTEVTRITSQLKDLKAIVGSDEDFKAMHEWANDNLTASEKDAFNDSLSRGFDSARFAVEALNARHKSSDGRPSKTQLRGTELVSKGDIYLSTQDWLLDMQNPLYKSSPEFQKKVIDKRMRSKGLD